MSPFTLVLLSFGAATLGFADLLTGFAGGIALIAPLMGVALGWLPARRGASRRSAGAAVAVNAIVLVTTIVAAFIFGGS